jgi:hypothetical protein
MRSAEPSSGRSREDVPEPAASLPAPASPGRVATIVAPQRSVGNAEGLNRPENIRPILRDLFGLK